MNPAIRVATLAVGLLVLGAAGPARAAESGIPARPEELKFPPLKYDPPKASQYRVPLKSGIVAYLVPDRSLPLVTVSVIMRIGPDLDPPGKEGVAQGTIHLLTRSGTATRTAQQLEDRLAYLGAQLSSQMGSGGGGFFGGGVPIGAAESHVTLNLLSKDLDEGLAILTECLQSPAFEQERFDLARQQILQSMKERNDESSAIEAREWGFLARGEGHWTNRYPTKASVESVTPDDLRAFVRRWVGPRNFVLAVSGDFDRATMQKKLEQAFGSWPTPGERPAAPPGPARAMEPGWNLVDKEVNQGRVTIGLPGIDRYDPDYHAARVMNDILGGGGFTSRLVNRIRSDEGLAYSVGSRLDDGVYYADAWRAAFQSKVRTVAYAARIALEEIGRMRDTPVTQEELDLTKNKFVEGFPAFFQTPSAIAGVLAVEELTGRYQKDPKYFEEYRDRVRKVSAQDVQRVARRLLDPAKVTVLMVGDVDEMMTGDPKHDASLKGLAGGEPRRLPLRDPMTMRPLPNP